MVPHRPGDRPAAALRRRRSPPHFPDVALDRRVGARGAGQRIVGGGPSRKLRRRPGIRPGPACRPL